MSLEQEIKDFMKSIGVDIVGLAGPGRFDGPPSLDPDYVLKGAQSVISFAIPFNVEAIYAYLSRKTAIPHNIDQYRVHQRIIHAAIKLKKFLEDRGHRAAFIEPNGGYRKDLKSTLALVPKFSHRYASYVAGIASPGISGSAITREYGGAVCLNSVITDAVLEGDPMLPPRYYFDGLCQSCMACKSACPPKMFMSTEEEYSLINGELWPRGRKRDVNLCAVSCGGLHAVSADKTWSNWGKGWIDSWTGVEPDPEKQNIFKDMVSVFGLNKDLSARISPIALVVQYPVEEGYFEESGPFPTYEELEGETEGQKLRSFADALEPLVGNAIADPLALTCNQCNLVCGPNAEESQKRWKMIQNGGILCFKENNEPYFAHDFDEAVELRKESPYQIKEQVKKESFKLRFGLMAKNFGIDFHAIIKGRKYRKKLAKSLEEKGLPAQ
jgi:ferredoxin